MNTYDAGQLALILGGVPIVGFAEGSELKITPSTDLFNTTFGTSGNYVRSKQIDKGAEVTFELLLNSPSNTYLNSLVAADKLTGNGVVPFYCKSNHALNPEVTSGSSWVMKPVELGYSISGDAPTRQWTLMLVNYTQAVGGGVGNGGGF